MRSISVIGGIKTGKSTFCNILAKKYGVDHLFTVNNSLSPTTTEITTAGIEIKITDYPGFDGRKAHDKALFTKAYRNSDCIVFVVHNEFKLKALSCLNYLKDCRKDYKPIFIFATHKCGDLKDMISSVKISPDKALRCETIQFDQYEDNYASIELLSLIELNANSWYNFLRTLGPLLDRMSILGGRRTIGYRISIDLSGIVTRNSFTGIDEEQLLVTFDHIKPKCNTDLHTVYKDFLLACKLAISLAFKDSRTPTSIEVPKNYELLLTVADNCKFDAALVPGARTIYFSNDDRIFVDTIKEIVYSAVF